MTGAPKDVGTQQDPLWRHDLGRCLSHINYKSAQHLLSGWHFRSWNHLHLKPLIVWSEWWFSWPRLGVWAVGTSRRWNSQYLSTRGDCLVAPLLIIGSMSWVPRWRNCRRIASMNSPALCNERIGGRNVEHEWISCWDLFMWRVVLVSRWTVGVAARISDLLRWKWCIMIEGFGGVPFVVIGSAGRGERENNDRKGKYIH